jgi:cysteine synthase A
MQGETHPVPDWVVMSAGTGGTSATIGRYIRYRNLATQLCVVDVENSVFYDAYRSGNLDMTRPRLTDRGDRPSARRAVLHSWRH